VPDTVLCEKKHRSNGAFTASDALELARRAPRGRLHVSLPDWPRDAAHREDWNLLGTAYVREEHPALAITCFEAGMEAGGVGRAVACRVGYQLAEEGRREQSIGCLRYALRFDMPAATAAGIHCFIASSLANLGCYEEAIAHFGYVSQAALPARTCAAALNQLGHVLACLERFDEAAPCFLGALAVPDEPEAMALRHGNLGSVLGQVGEYAEELQCYERALAIRPSPLTRVNRSLALLRLGDFLNGWREYEHRWGHGAPQEKTRRGFAEPLWTGGPVSGRRILLHAEQGFGDTIQFVRYVPLVAARGAEVILEVQPPLMRLLQGVPGVQHLIAHGDPLPAFDLQCPLLSLPLAFGTKVSTIPNCLPYVCTDAAVRKPWARRLDTEKRLKVGLVWAGSPAHGKDRTRSAPAECLAPLLRTEGAAFYSLQVGGRPGDYERLAAAGPLCDLAPLLTDFAETAAAIEHLDVLIAVDTAVAHLGGAMGAETWLMVPYVPDWRWMLNREDTPWYRNMRLFRQPARGDWPAVVERMRQELAAKIASREPVTA
jgi:tetratricopeptide (TPR) repeat protein